MDNVAKVNMPEFYRNLLCFVEAAYSMSDQALL